MASSRYAGVKERKVYIRRFMAQALEITPETAGRLFRNGGEYDAGLVREYIRKRGYKRKSHSELG